MKNLYCFIFLLIALTTRAQRIEQYYDWRWKRTDAESARFVAVMEKKGSLWERKDYFIHEKNLEMSGSYTDTSCKVEQGKFYYFHSDGNLESTGDFVNGKKQGPWFTFYQNKMMKDSAVYENGQMTGTALSWHSNGFPADSSIYNADESGVSVSWFDNGSLASAGLYAVGHQKNGKWKYFHKNGKLSANEIFDNGNLTDKQYFDEEGVAMADTSSRDREASFPSGQEGWKKFLSRQLYFPQEYKIVDADQAVVVVNGVIDEDGNMTDLKVSTPFYPAFDRIAVSALKKSPKWKPAIDHNRRVKYSFFQAVTFAQK